MGTFTNIPIAKLFSNVDEEALTSAAAALENAFITEAGGISRLPGMVEFTDIGGSEPVYLSEINNDMIAVKGDGRVYRLDKNANIEAISGPQVLGGRRVIFEKDESFLYMAAGKQIIQFDGVKTEILSDDAPNATHVGILNNHVIANEADSNRWRYSDVNQPRSWPELNVFAAVSKPGPVLALIATTFNEIFAAKSGNIDQYAPLVGGDVPFTWRWTVDDGVSEPYTLIFYDNAVWCLNEDHEFVRITGQTGQVVSGDIQKTIDDVYRAEGIDSFQTAWAVPLKIQGQKFIIVQWPDAENQYGSKGITYLFDVRQNKWSQLFGWDEGSGCPAIWPGVSVLDIWGRVFVGAYGKIFEIKPDQFANGSERQRFFWRTAHFTELSLVRIDSMRLTIKRGVGTYEDTAKLFMRVNRDRRGFSKWQSYDLGKAGQKEFQIFPGAQGDGYSWQFEFMTTDNCQLEIRKIEAEVTPMVR